MKEGRKEGRKWC